jgi:hypothetical protein
MIIDDEGAGATEGLRHGREWELGGARSRRVGPVPKSLDIGLAYYVDRVEKDVAGGVALPPSNNVN